MTKKIEFEQYGDKILHIFSSSSVLIAAMTLSFSFTVKLMNYLGKCKLTQSYKAAPKQSRQVLKNTLKTNKKRYQSSSLLVYESLDLSVSL